MQTTISHCKDDLKAAAVPLGYSQSVSRDSGVNARIAYTRTRG